MKKQWLESLPVFTCILYIFFFVSFLIGCSSSSHSELWAGADKPSHHTENGFQNYPLIESDDTQGFRFIWTKRPPALRPVGLRARTESPAIPA